jgi:hypothetical protein
MLYQGVNTMDKDVLIVRQPESEEWACSPVVGIAGNQTVERVVERIQHSLSSQSTMPWDFYLWESEGQHYDVNNEFLEKCDRWHLSRYEVCPAPADSKYQAVVILYYEPVIEMAIAA